MLVKLIEDGFLRLCEAINTVDSKVSNLVPSKVSITVAPASYDQFEFSISDLSVTPSSIIICNLVPNSEWDADDLMEYKVIAQPTSGSVQFTLLCDGPLVGNYTITYSIYS